MRPSDFQRNIALLLYMLDKKNLFKTDDDRNYKASILGGVTKTTLKKWLSDENTRESTLRQVNSNLVHNIENTKPELKITDPENFLENVGAMTLADYLGLSRAECRKAIDQEISAVMATFGIFSLDSDLANRTWKEFANNDGGYFLGYRMETSEVATNATGRSSNVMRFPLAIRHRLRGNKSMSKKYEKIRAKLNIHAMKGQKHFFEYDGYMTGKDTTGTFNLLFQSRNQNPDDLLYLTMGEIERAMSEIDDKHVERLFSIGTLVSRNQDHPPKSTIWPVVFEKVDIENLLEVRESSKPLGWDNFDDCDSYFMRTQHGLVNPTDIDETLKSFMRKANQVSSFSRFEF